MNLESFPKNVKEDVEDQSLELLATLTDNILVIGGWAVRGLLGEMHGRYTLDIDAVATREMRGRVKEKLISIGMKPNETDWGIQYYKQYEAGVTIPPNVDISKLQLRIEISDPRIPEIETDHYFEFNLKEIVTREIPFHKSDRTVEIMIPPPSHMAAVKLGLPVDYKNNYDAVMLLQLCEIKDVIEVIETNDHWSEMVLRRIPKLIGRIKDKNNTANLLAKNAGVDIRNHILKLEEIERKLKSIQL